jgi:hypothetical protein
VSKFVIDPSSVDFNEIYADLEAYINSAPEALRWKDNYNNSAGKIIKEIVAGNATFKNLEAILARREAYLMSAENRSSVVGIAQYKGYSVFRGQNARITITLVPDFTGTLEKFSAIGTVKDTDLVLLENTPFISGQPVTIIATIGDVKEEIKTITSDRPNFFRFTRNIVSEDIDLFLNDNRVDFSNKMVDAENEKFVCLSNPFGSVDVFYLNKPSFTVKYGVNDQLKLKFVNLDNRDFELTDVTLSIGAASSMEFTSNYEEEESVEAIKVNAPIYSETQYVIRGREDYIKLFRLLETDVVSTNYVDISPMVVRLYYVRGDDLLYSPSEKAAIIDKLALNRNMGLQPPEIAEAVRCKIQINVAIQTFNISGTLPQDVSAIVDSYQNTLGVSIDFFDIENQIERFTDVKVARLTVGSTPWVAGQYYEPEQHVSPTVSNGFIYRAKDILRFSANVEPVWPTVVDDTVIDNELIWKCKYLERQCDPINPILPIIPPRSMWDNATSYSIGQIVIPTSLDIYEYEMVGFVHKSDAMEPTWPALAGGTASSKVGSEVRDNKILWRAIELVGSPTAWQATTQYNIGDIVIATDPSASDCVGLMFQAVSILGRTAGSQPTWPITVNDEVIDGTILWECRKEDVSPKKLRNDRYYKIQRTISIT